MNKNIKDLSNDEFPINADSWMIISVNRKGGGFIRTPTFYQNIPKFKHAALMGIHVLYLTIITEDWYCLSSELQGILITRAVTLESKVYDMATQKLIR